VDVVGDVGLVRLEYVRLYRRHGGFDPAGVENSSARQQRRPHA
jgi:hypothetical protein